MDCLPEVGQNNWLTCCGFLEVSIYSTTKIWKSVEIWGQYTELLMEKQNLTYLSGDYQQLMFPPHIDKYIADYNPVWRLSGLTHFNSTVMSPGYDNANRLTSLENRKSDTSAIATYQFTLDGNGNRTQSTQSEPLTPTLTDSNTTYSYNQQKNRLTSAGGYSFGYDYEGQLNSGYGNSYTFDYEHRLKTIGNNVQFTYDGGGKRLKAMRSNVETRYIYDPAGNLLAEADGNNNIARIYIYGKGLIAMVTATDQFYVYHYNATGSTIAVTDGSQAVVNKYAYDPFGNILSQVDAVPQPFKYVGQFGVMTEPNGFYYMRARYYDPQVGRFVSEDPIGFNGGDVNLMAYVGNNPIMGVDPSGLDVYLGRRAIHGFSNQYGALHHEFLVIENSRLPGGIAYFGLTANSIIGKGRITIKDSWDINNKDHDGSLTKISGIDENKLINNIINEQSNAPFYIFGIHDCQSWARGQLEQAKTSASSTVSNTNGTSPKP
jgi:RHS repeat-associated protein